jgi:SAM-dependent methyltransferase
VSDGALECSYDPLLALADLRRRLSEGGLLLLVSSLHGPMARGVYFRFTSSGAAVLLAQAGFEVLERGDASSPGYARAMYGGGGGPATKKAWARPSAAGFNRESSPNPTTVTFWFLARKAAVSVSKGGKARTLAHPRLGQFALDGLWARHAVHGPAYWSKHAHPVALGAHAAAGGANTFNLLTANRDYPRVPIVLDFFEWVRTYNISSPQRLLTTDPTDVEMHNLRYSEPAKVCAHVHRTVGHDPKSKHFGKELGDLHKMDDSVQLRGQPFDLAVVSQTLEHLYDPLLSLVNLRHKLRHGGLLFTSTPAVNRPHMTPYHFRHYSPHGLAALLTQAGFEILETGQWGNKEYLDNLFKLGGMNWPAFNLGHVTPPGADPEDPAVAVENDPGLPVQVWALVRRPLQDADSPCPEEARGHYKNAEQAPCFFPHPKNRRGKNVDNLPPFAIAATKDR